MNEREEKLLLKRIGDLTKIIREQHKLPKSKRDPTLINTTKAAIATISLWLDDHKTEEPKKPGIITKAEFKDHVSSIVDLSPKAVMVVEDVATLEQIWWTALANNISLQLNENNPALMKRFKQLVREHKSRALKQRG
jgi:DNA mismatch repair ATPase MutS